MACIALILKAQNIQKGSAELFVHDEDNQGSQLKNELSSPHFAQSGNSILKKNKSLNTYSSWQDYARKKIKVSSERYESKLQHLGKEKYQKAVKLYEI